MRTKSGWLFLHVCTLPAALVVVRVSPNSIRKVSDFRRYTRERFIFFHPTGSAQTQQNNWIVISFTMPSPKKTPAKASPKKAKLPVVKKEKTTPRRDTKSPHQKSEVRKTRSTIKSGDLVSLGANGKDVIQGTGSKIRDLTDQVKSIPKYQRLSHQGRAGRSTEEQPEAKLARKKQKAKVAVEKRRVETEEEFLEQEEAFGSQVI